MHADLKARSAPFISERKVSFDGNEQFELPANLKPKTKATEDRVSSTSRKKGKRRNSTGTTYVSATLVKQDNDLTIMCVCRVLHAYILDAFKTRKKCSKEYAIFTDVESGGKASDSDLYSQSPDDAGDDWMVGTSPVSSREAKINNYGTSNYGTSPTNSPCHGLGDVETLSEQALPTVDSLYLFFQCIFRTSQLESECIIIALIYLERLMRETNSRFCIRHDNWHSSIFVCLMMASKVWDDLSMWNSDFSQIIPGYGLDRLNNLELCILEALHYNMKVPPGQYAKYYFILRSLISQLGLSTATETEELLKGSSLDLAKSKAMGPMTPIHINLNKIKIKGKSKKTS